MTDKPRLLIIDDEIEIGKYIRLVANQNGYDALEIDDPAKLEEVYSRDLAVIIVDMFMPHRDGVEILRFLAKDHYRGQIVVISGHDRSVLNSAMELANAHGLNILGALSKPILYTDIQNLLFKGLQNITPDDPTFVGEVVLPTLEDFRLGLERGEFQPHFQPQTDIATGKLMGVEALIRWKHPVLGMQPPSIIIPMAETGGFMEQLTMLVLTEALEWTTKWKKAGMKIRTSVNMSASGILDLNLPELVDAELQARGLEPGQLVLEVTEQTLMSELSTSLDILTRLRIKEIELSIDDFGTGHSSLAQLYRVPFSEIKIDRSFVSKAEDDNEAQSIVEMTIALAHKLKMVTVAEGIETQKTMDLMKKLGCDIAQGYFIARPMPGEEILDWEKKRK